VTTTNTTTSTAGHRPVIKRGVDSFDRKVYRMVCTCGARGEEHAARRLAEWDLNEHVSALPRVPAAQQCHTPKTHDRRPWEPCQACERQEALFDAPTRPAERT
jgi:hypothetical protein